MTQQPLLEVQGLKKYFPLKRGLFIKSVVGAVKAVDDVSFTLNSGETLGIVGESGCGKSTIAKCILRLIEPTAGKVLFEGKDICPLSMTEMRTYRKYMQMIFQNPYASLDPQMTVAKILEEPLLIQHFGDKQSRRQRIMEIIREVGLDDTHYDSYPHEFSGGQRQRIAIARALVTRPKVIIADEAVSALDVSIQAQILNLMQQLQQKYGLTYIFISHSLPVIRHISTTIGVLYLGKMMEYAPKKELFAHPEHPYTQGLLNAVPSLANRRKKGEIILAQDVPSASNPPSGCVFHTRCPYCKDICKEQIPELKEVGSHHWVACHR
jgi:oligopeptide transport system ATP-binding protein